MSSYVKNHLKEYKGAFATALDRSLVRIGLSAEGYAINLCPVDTGYLRNSITFALSGESANKTAYRAKVKKGAKPGQYSGTAPDEPKGKAVYIGSNVEYAAHVELGTGNNNVGGRPTPWAYQDDKGNWHHTNGQRAQPYLRPALANHLRTYKNIIKDEFENA